MMGMLDFLKDSYLSLSSKNRRQPNFLIIGVQRGGTTSLYKNLCRHPRIRHAKSKELHFFDLHYHRGLDWYKRKFEFNLNWKGDPNERILTGEASPYYIFHPFSLLRIKKHYPDIKLIILLRDPVRRAYSHYWHEKDRGFETLEFMEAVKQEKIRLANCADEFSNLGYSENHFRYAYVERGKYIEQIKRCYTLFPRNQIFITDSESYFNNSQETMDKICAFLSIDEWDFALGEYAVKRNFPELSPDEIQHLENIYRSYNLELYEYLGIDFGWDHRNRD